MEGAETSPYRQLLLYGGSYSERGYQEECGIPLTYHRLFIQCLTVKVCLFQNSPTVFSLDCEEEEEEEIHPKNYCSHLLQKIRNFSECYLC
jgi:hypothetical protein